MRRLVYTSDGAMKDVSQLDNILLGNTATALGQLRVAYVFDQPASDESRETIFNLIIDIFNELRHTSGLWGAAYKSANIDTENRTVSASIPPSAFKNSSR